MPRYAVKWSIFPKAPWVVRDLVTGCAVPSPSGRGFLHYDTPEQAGRVADRLNAASRRAPKSVRAFAEATP